MTSPSSTGVIRRDLDVVVISDVHLGTFGCKAAELVTYLQSIRPRKLIINGDFVDIWQFSKRYFPRAHLQVIKEVLNLLTRGTEVIYITGNHDEMLRRLTDLSIGNFHLVNKYTLELDGRTAWLFHGDVFDATLKNAKWLARLGSTGYGVLILINKLVNFFLLAVGRERMSFSKSIKSRVKHAFKRKRDYEQVASELAIEKNYDYLILGHIHQPQVRKVRHRFQDGEVIYLNSGDWMEHKTALEYQDGQWTLFYFNEKGHRPRRYMATKQHQCNENLREELLNDPELVSDPGDAAEPIELEGPMMTQPATFSFRRMRIGKTPIQPADTPASNKPKPTTGPQQ